MTPGVNRLRAAVPFELRLCPACEGTGKWPTTSTNDCLVCRGTGRWAKESEA